MEDQPEFADSLCQRTTAEHPRKPQGPGTRALPPVTMLTGIQAHPTGGDSAEILVAIDVGTSGARAAAYDVAGRLAGEVRRSYPTNVGSDGRAEQDANRWRSASLSALEGLVRELGPKKQIRAIGVTGQCPSVVPLDGRDRPLRPGLIYRDNHAAAEALEIRRQFGDQAFHQRTGHLPAAFHVAAKIVGRDRRRSCAGPSDLVQTRAPRSQLPGLHARQVSDDALPSPRGGLVSD
jgi:hypothetical protein